MFKLIWKLFFYSLVLIIVFAIITLWGEGGDKFRWIGQKTGGFVKKYTDEIGYAADDLYSLVGEKKKEMGKGRKLIDE